LSIANFLAPKYTNQFTITLGQRFAKATIGRSINKKDLMSVFTTTRTAKDKIDVNETLHSLMGQDFVEVWKIAHEELLLKAEEIAVEVKVFYKNK